MSNTAIIVSLIFILVLAAVMVYMIEGVPEMESIESKPRTRRVRFSKVRSERHFNKITGSVIRDKSAKSDASV